MSTWIPAKKWKRRGANLPRNVVIAKTRDAAKKVRVASRKSAEALWHSAKRFSKAMKGLADR